LAGFNRRLHPVIKSRASARDRQHRLLAAGGSRDLLVPPLLQARESAVKAVETRGDLGELAQGLGHYGAA
jgi:hypothetical protein